MPFTSTCNVESMLERIAICKDQPTLYLLG